MSLRRLRKGSALRQRAEQRLKSQPPASGEQRSVEQTHRLVHELRVREIELEMQNEELRMSRAELEAVLEQYTDLYDFAPVGYFTIAPDGIIRSLNLPASRLLQLERARLVGRSFGDYVVPGTRPVFDAWLAEVFAMQGKHTCAISLVRSGSESRALELEATLSPNGQDARMVAVDVTARKILEEQLRQAQKMEVIGQLAGGVAHDFNNILAAMLLNLGLLQRQHELPSDAQPALCDLEALAKRASSLTSQLLLFSRRNTIQTRQVELNAALTHLLKMVGRLLGEDIKHARLGNTSELWIAADIAVIEQTVMNLCLNARDAMPNGGTLTLETSVARFDDNSVRLHPESRPGEFACLRISDTGCGMGPDVLQHLFEPFYTTKELGKGTGLGLSSAYGAVHQHQGWLQVESEPGRGTTFRLYFPLSPQPGPALPAAVVPAPETTRKHRTILLVEDEPELLRASSRALTQFGYFVLPAIDGEQASELWKQHRDDIALLLTDMRMPKGISGLQLAERLWQSKPSLKVIIMSGYNTGMGYRIEAAAAGYTFLPKPFDLDSLAVAIRLCLGDQSRLVSLGS